MLSARDIKKVEQDRKRLTEFAKELFPEDPVKVDYPLYMLGRWIGGKHLRILKAPSRLQLLKDYLQFWKKIYNKIQRPPVTFDIVSRGESTFEQNIRSELEKLQFMFSFEPHIFNLAENQGAPRYTPDFVLPNCKKNGKIVILEPMVSGHLARRGLSGLVTEDFQYGFVLHELIQMS